MKTKVKKREEKDITFIRGNSREGASHGRLVPLHLPLLGFCFFSFLFFFFCIINLYCILQEEYPIKLWEKKKRFWSLVSNGNMNYYKSIQIEFLKLFAAKKDLSGRIIFSQISPLHMKPFVAATCRATCHPTYRQGVTCRLDVLQRHVAKANFPFVNGPCHF